MNHEKNALLSVQNLYVTFPTPSGQVHAVNGITYHVQPGEIMGIIGESGSGKSASAYAVMRLLQSPGKITGGEVIFNGVNVQQLTAKELTHFRGSQIGMIFQDPMKCLDPVFTIGWQLMETVLAHEKLTIAAARSRAVKMLVSVGIHEPERIMKAYPHELSGGMLQRVMIAIALIARPKLLIADEPTTALDVTIQKQIIHLLKALCLENHMGMVFITHNFGIIAEICDRVTVMYGGKIMERGTVEEIFHSPAHPYTISLIRAIPKLYTQADQRLIPIPGVPINPMKPPSGCPFWPRCPESTDICRKAAPPEVSLSEHHGCVCWKRVKEETANA